MFTPTSPRRHCLRRAVLTMMAGLITSGASMAGAQTFSVSNFVNDDFHIGAGTTSLDFGDGGRIYATEKRGRIITFARNANGTYASPTVFADLTNLVDSALEGGLLGIAADPDFATNRYLYVFYSTTTDQRLVRYTANAAGTTTSGTPTILLSGLPKSSTVHNGGHLEFRPGEPGSIYMGLGDDDQPSEAQSLTSYRGKMLRVDKTNGQGFTTNPYYVSGGTNTLRARLWAIGMRNPWRFTFHPVANQPLPDVMYVSENGDSTDKLSWVRGGSNGSWSPAGDNGGFLNPPDMNHRVLETRRTTNLGVAIAASGPFSDGGQPALYMANGSFGILRWRLTGATLNQLTAIPADAGQPFVSGLVGVHLKFGPDGSLYYTQTSVDASSDTIYTLGRIQFVGGTPPTASFTTSPNPPRGNFPLTVNFTDQSTDSDGSVTGWDWDFGDGNTSTQRSPSHTYATPGSYTATLEVTDDDGLTNAATIAVEVNAAFTLDLQGEILDGNTLNGGRRTGATIVGLYESDLTPLSFPGGTGPDENQFTVQDGDIDRSLPINVMGTELIVSVGDGVAGLIPHRIAVSVPTMQASTTVTLRAYPSRTAIWGRILDTRGDPVVVDIGTARGDIASLHAMVSARDYLAGSGIMLSGVAHRITSEAPLGYYYLPVRQGGQYFLDVVGDTGSSTYVSTLLQPMVMDGQGLELDISVGLQSGGAGCDDLSDIPETLNVDYASQIEPLWVGTCTGCHKPNSANGGGLSLTVGTSYAAMVNVASTQVPGLAMVEPGDPAASYLLEKISCDNPQVGNRMRPGSPMDRNDQALVRDWIAQGARATGSIPDAGMPPEDMMSTPDAGSPDLGEEMDAGVEDLPPDVGPEDAAAPPPPDAGVVPDATMSAPDVLGPGEILGSSCTCAVSRAHAASPMAPWAWLGLLLVACRIRRRRPSL